MASPLLIDEVNRLREQEITTIPIKKVYEYITSHDRALKTEEMLQIAIIICRYWNTHESSATIKKKSTPYKIRPLYKNSGSKVLLDELPDELVLLIYVYVKHLFE